MQHSRRASHPGALAAWQVNQCNHAIANHNESHDLGGGGDDKTVAFCKSHGISYSAFSPLEGLSGYVYPPLFSSAFLRGWFVASVCFLLAVSAGKQSICRLN